MSLIPEFDATIGMMVVYNRDAGVPYDKDYADHLREVQMAKNMKDEPSRPQKIVLAGCGLGVLTGVGAIIYIGGKLSRLW